MLRIRLSEKEKRELDEKRGEVPMSAYVRSFIFGGRIIEEESMPPVRRDQKLAKARSNESGATPIKATAAPSKEWKPLEKFDWWCYECSKAKNNCVHGRGK